MTEREEFETWWEAHGQFCRAGGGDYEKTFAFSAWQARASLPVNVPVGMEPDVFDNREFYELHQAYRHAKHDPVLEYNEIISYCAAQLAQVQRERDEYKKDAEQLRQANVFLNGKLAEAIRELHKLNCGAMQKEKE